MALRGRKGHTQARKRDEGRALPEYPPELDSLFHQTLHLLIGIVIHRSRQFLQGLKIRQRIVVFHH